MRKKFKRKQGPVRSKKVTVDGIQFASGLEKYMYLALKEAKIVARFWIIGILLAVLSIVTLKLPPPCRQDTFILIGLGFLQEMRLYAKNKDLIYHNRPKHPYLQPRYQKVKETLPNIRYGD